MTSPQPAADGGVGSARTGLLVLAVAVFAAATTELLPVGLLPQISSAFDLSNGTTGLLVSAYAAMVAVLARWHAWRGQGPTHRYTRDAQGSTGGDPSSREADVRGEVTPASAEDGWTSESAGP